MDAVVSAVITTCKRSPVFVVRALKSVMAQTYPHIQIIVVDDSPANYPEKETVRKAVLSECPQVVFVAHGENRGACAARNTGIQAAAGEYVAFLDDDDEWLPEKIEKELAGFTSENIALVYGDLCMSDDIRHIRYAVGRKSFSGKVYDQLLESCFIGSTSIPLFRKHCLVRVGCFDEQMRSAQDYDLYLRLARHFEVNYIPEVFVIYHIHKEARISTNTSDLISGRERLITKYESDLKQNPRAWVHQRRDLIIQYRRDGNIRQSLRIWNSVVRKAAVGFSIKVKYLILSLVSLDSFVFRIYLRLKTRRLKVKTP